MLFGLHVTLMDDVKPVIKIVFVGDTGVGKTYFISHFCSETPPLDQHLTTIGIDCQSNDFTHYNHNTYKIQLWDTSGCERFHSITKSFFRKADLTIIMVDLSRSLEEVNASIAFWTREINEIVDVPILVIGNKRDLSGPCQHAIERQICSKVKDEVHNTMHDILIHFINHHPPIKHVLVVENSHPPNRECCALL